jgi:hypothetical protein
MNFAVGPIDELLWSDPGFLSRLLHFLPMLIDTGQEKNLFALQPMISRDDVSEHLLVGVTDVWRAVGVVDGGGDVERLWHPALRYCGRRLCRATAEISRSRLSLIRFAPGLTVAVEKAPRPSSEQSTYRK